MNCPKCTTALEAVTMDGIEVDVCPACKGVWFDKFELGPLLDSHDEAVKPLLGGADGDDKNYRRGVKCPRDDADLLRVNSARNHEVTVDVCMVCQGVWLDGGEFERIKTAQPGIRLGDLI